MCVGVLLELLLRLPSQVSDQPLGGEGVLRRHPVAHHGVEESLPLSRVETQDLEERQQSIQFDPHKNQLRLVDMTILSPIAKLKYQRY